MALLDRVKERIETDLSDAELQSMIDAVGAEIERRHGPLGVIAVVRDGGTGIVRLQRPLDEGAGVSVVEIEPGNQDGAASRTTLGADDYRILNRGRLLERLIDGGNGRKVWAPRVEVTYTPTADTEQREELTIKLVQLDVQYRGLSMERAGDWQANYPDAAAARETLLQSLSPRSKLTMA